VDEIKPRIVLKPRPKKWRVLLTIAIALIVLPWVIYGIAYIVTELYYSPKLNGELMKLEYAGKPYRIEQFVAAMTPEETRTTLAWRWICYDVLWSEGDAESKALDRFLATGRVDEADRAVLLGIVARNTGVLSRAKTATETPASIPADSLADRGRPAVPFVSIDFGRLACLQAALIPETEAECHAMIAAFARAIRNEPGPVDQYVRLALYDLLLDRLQRKLPQKLKKEDLAFYVDVLAPARASDMRRLAFLGERAAGIETFESVLEGRRTLKEAFGLHYHGILPGWIVNFMACPGDPWLKGFFARYLVVTGKLVDAMNLPYPEASKAWDTILEEIYKEEDFLVKGLIPPTRGRLLPFAMLEARLALGRVAIGLERETTDPFGRPGAMIRTRRDADIRVLWSVGPNGVDDGAEGDDIVWRVPVRK
jgi:hypothetical protein